MTSAGTASTTGSTNIRQTDEEKPRQAEKAIIPAPRQPKEQSILLDTQLRRPRQTTVDPSPSAKGHQCQSHNSPDKDKQDGQAEVARKPGAGCSKHR